jgi:hypothetical protein
MHGKFVAAQAASAKLEAKLATVVVRSFSDSLLAPEATNESLSKRGAFSMFYYFYYMTFGQKDTSTQLKVT